MLSLDYRRLACVLVCSVLWTASLAGAQAVGAAPEQLFARGVEAADAGRWVEAERAFAAVCEMAPTPSALLNLATARYRQVKPLSALEALDQLDAVAGVSDRDRRLAARMRAQCLSILAELVIQVEPTSAWVRVDSEPVETRGASTSVRVDPGSHHVRAGADGYTSAEERVSVAEGERSVVDLSLEKLVVQEPEPAVTLTTSGPPAAQREDGVDDDRRKRRRRALLTVAALVVAGGAAAGAAVALTGGTETAACTTASVGFGDCQ